MSEVKEQKDTKIESLQDKIVGFRVRDENFLLFLLIIKYKLICEKLYLFL